MRESAGYSGIVPSLAQPFAQPTPTATPTREAPPAGPRISGLELADAEMSFSQDEVLTMLEMKGDEFAERIFGRCGVQRRHLNLSGESLATTLQGRTAQIEEELFGYAVQAFDRLEVDPLEIGTVVTATLYSLGGPTLAHRMVDHYEMDPSHRQVPRARCWLRERRAADAPRGAVDARAPRSQGPRGGRREHGGDTDARLRG